MDSVLSTASSQLNQSTRLGSISRLPPEMFRAILHRVPAHHLIPLRSVSTGWKSVSEDICRNKTCLLIVWTDWNKNHCTELLKRFNGHLKLCHNELVLIRLPCISRQSMAVDLSAQFCTLLSKLFPRIEKFVVDAQFQCSNKFISMLRQWKSTLTTLSLRRLSSLDLCVQINQMTNLQQLSLAFTFPVNKLAPTLARIQHLSVSNLSSIFHDILPYFNEQSRLTSLATCFNNIQSSDITKWQQVNTQLISRLVRLSLRIDSCLTIEFVCKLFTALKVLYIDYKKTQFPS